MNERRRLLEETTKRVDRIINKIIVNAKTPRDYGTGELLHLAEIHTINAVGSNPKINITKLSKCLGVTKGTVSPLVNKLEKKNYLKKLCNVYDGKSVLMELTEKGEIARKGFEKYYKKFYSQYSKGFTFGQLAILNEFLIKMETYLNDTQDEE